MPPKQRITREMILERSFEMFTREGMGMVNARSVAKALNCSTQPIFSYFSGMEDLKDAIEQRAKESFEQAIAGLEAEQKPALRVCAAYVQYALRQPQQFAHLFMRPDGGVCLFMTPERRDMLAQRESEQSGLPQEQAQALIDRLTVYAHGFATLFAVKKGAYTIEQAERMLAEAYDDMTAHGRR